MRNMNYYSRCHLTAGTDPTQYTIVQEVVKEGPSSPVSMFSAVYKFAYRSKEPEWADSPALSSTPSDQSVDDTRTPGTTHPSISFDALLPMDPTSFVECEDFDTYFDFNDIDMKSNWGFPPSQYPDDISSGYEVLQLCGSQRDMFDRISGSPVEACFHTEPYNYVSCSQCLTSLCLLTCCLSRPCNTILFVKYRMRPHLKVLLLVVSTFHPCYFPCEFGVAASSNTT